MEVKDYLRFIVHEIIYAKVDIYFTATGMINIPTEQEILAMMKEIWENPQDFRFVA